VNDCREIIRWGGVFAAHCRNEGVLRMST
jgi:hypothetical protein